jgi:hypothetical protein
VTGEEAEQELGPYTEVADTLIFAAVERAVLHEQEDEVSTSALTAHLGFRWEPDTNRPLWSRLEGLRRAGLLTVIERRGEPFWSLTDVGRERLASARGAGEVDDLPESPQHRAWRHARAKAAVRVGGFRSDMHDVLREAGDLIGQDRPVTSRECFELSERLRLASWRFASATYCLTEWLEPGDDRPDEDEDEDPGPRPGRRATWAWDQDTPTGDGSWTRGGS